MLLQIKTSKVCVRTEGRRSGYYDFYILSGKLLYFFLGLSDYWDKFPKMFCSSCGWECSSTANFCHQCSQQLNLSQVLNNAARSVDKEKLLGVFPLGISLRRRDVTLSCIHLNVYNSFHSHEYGKN